MDTGGYGLLFAYSLTDVRAPSESEYFQMFRHLGFFLWERRHYKTVAENVESDVALSLLRRVVETLYSTSAQGCDGKAAPSDPSGRIISEGDQQQG